MAMIKTDTSGITYVARFVGGPFDGRTSISMEGFPPDEVVAFKMQFFMEGSILVKPNEGKDDLTGDAIYRKVAQSLLYDTPEKLPMKHVLPGATYEYVVQPIEDNQ